MRDEQEIRLEPVKMILPDRVLAYIIVSIIGIFFVIFLVLPLVQILKTSFSGETGFTLRNYIEYFGKARIRRSFYNSFYVAGITTVVTTAAAFFVAYAMTRTTIRGKSFYKAVS